MNNSFSRLIDGMNATLRKEVLGRLDDEFARGQVFGVINLLNTFKVRADWSAAFLLEQTAAQRGALEGVAGLLAKHPGADPLPELPSTPAPVPVPIDELLALRDRQNLAICRWLAWLDAQREALPPETSAGIEDLLRGAMRAELAIELKNAPRPLFAEMSSGTED